jgi:subtilase family serine protease
VFFLLVIVYALCVQSPLALSAESEPMVSLPGGVAPHASELLAAATPAHADMPIRLRIYLDLRNKEAARKMSDDLHNASSPIYHKWINPQKFDELFGPLPASYDAIAAWLKSQGFSVNAIRRDRRDVEFTGTVAQADQAFHVQIMSMRDGKQYGILSDPMISARFQGVILGVVGLDNLNSARGAATVTTPNGNVTAFAPADFYTFYDENSLLNAGINGNITASPVK